MDKGDSDDDEDADSSGSDPIPLGYTKQMKHLKASLFMRAKRNIDDAQMKQKRDYDKRHVTGNKVIKINTLVVSSA